MKKTRFAAALLCTLLASQALIACGETTGDEQKDTKPVTTEPVTEADTNAHDDLGDITFGGRTFTMFLAHPNGGFVMEEETGDVYDDAIYYRNRAVEERLDIVLNYIQSGLDSSGSGQSEQTAKMRTLISAGDTTNDVYLHVQHTGMPAMIAEGFFQDWRDMPNVDFSKPYWFQRCLDDINYYDKVMGMTGSYNMATMTSTNCLFFNKRILNDLDIEYPYQDVFDGVWTVDKFYKMIEDTTYDLNGDGMIDADHDRLGYWGWGYEQVPAFFMGLGGDVVVKQKDGSPLISVSNDRMSNLVDQMHAVFDLPGALYEYSTYGIFNTKFINGELTFVHGHLSLATSFRDMPDDFGFIPYPKLNEEQEGYVCRVQNTSGLTYIPVTNDDLAFTGACLEIMACESFNTTLPVFFDKVLTVKTARDTESEQMVPIIREAASFFDEAAGFAVKDAALGSGLASYWASAEAKITENVQKYIIDAYSD